VSDEQLPIIVLLRLCVPVVSDELPKDGWSRPVSTMQMLILPVVVSAAFMSRHVLPTDGEWVWAVAVIGGGLLLGATLAVIMWVYTEDETPPRWHKYMCFVGFAAAVLFIYMTAAEIVNIILAFGVVFEVGNFSLGVSILAIGIGMQDLVSNIGVARAGYPNMAASACIGAPLLNILLGLGVCAIAGNAFVANPYPLSLSTQLLVCLFFLLGSVALAVSFMLFYDYRADFSMGVLLVSLYVVFLVVTLALDEYDTDAYGSAAAAKASVDARGGRGDFKPIST
jgi:solute carrier family 24 (sodium/potassium/calcium exchanger), member 6